MPTAAKRLISAMLSKRYRGTFKLENRKRPKGQRLLSHFFVIGNRIRKFTSTPVWALDGRVPNNVVCRFLEMAMSPVSIFEFSMSI